MQANTPSLAASALAPASTPVRPAAPQAAGGLRTVAFSLLVDRALSA